MKNRPEIKQQARDNFQAQYGISVAAILIFVAIGMGVSIISSITMLTRVWGPFGFGYMFGRGMTFSQLSTLSSIFLLPPLWVGYSSFSLRIYRGQTGDIGEMFREGFSNYWRKVGGILWMELFVFLWSLLLVIPGIVKAISYFMTPYILAESKNVTATDALKLSMRMTEGYKGEIFVMGLSFIGWAILTGLTGGILGIFYTGPYMYTSFAGMYEELKQNALARGIVTPEELV